MVDYNFQSRVMESLKSNLGEDNSVSRWLQETLEVEYSTARRKYNGDIKLSLEQFGRMITRAPDLLNLALKDHLGANTFITSYHSFRNKQELITHLRWVIHGLEKGLKHQGELLYIARDLPFFFFFGDRTLAEYKISLWSHQLKDQQPVKLDIDTYSICREVYRLYQLIPGREIWHNQIWANQFAMIDWFCKFKKMSPGYGEDLHAALSQQAIQYKGWAAEGLKNRKGNFELLFSDFITMSNGGLINSNDLQLLMATLNSVNFITLRDERLCENFSNEFEIHSSYATSVSRSNALERERRFDLSIS